MLDTDIWQRAKEQKVTTQQEQLEIVSFLTADFDFLDQLEKQDLMGIANVIRGGTFNKHYLALLLVQYESFSNPVKSGTEELKFISNNIIDLE